MRKRDERKNTETTQQKKDNTSNNNNPPAKKPYVMDLKPIPFFGNMPQEIFINQVMRPYFTWKDLGRFRQVNRWAYDIGLTEAKGISNAVNTDPAQKEHILPKFLNRFGYRVYKNRILTQNYYSALDQQISQTNYDKYDQADIVPNNNRETEARLNNKKRFMNLLHSRKFEEARDFYRKNKLYLFFADINHSSPLVVLAAHGKLEEIVRYANEIDEFPRKFKCFYAETQTQLIHPLIAALRCNQSAVAQYLLSLDLRSDIMREAFALIVNNNDKESFKIFISGHARYSLELGDICWAIEKFLNFRNVSEIKMMIDKVSWKLSEGLSPGVEEALNIKYPSALMIVKELSLNDHVNDPTDSRLYGKALLSNNEQVLENIKAFIEGSGVSLDNPKILSYSLSLVLRYGKDKLIHRFLELVSESTALFNLHVNLSEVFKVKNYWVALILLQFFYNYSSEFFYTYLKTWDCNDDFQNMNDETKCIFLFRIATLFESDDAKTEEAVFIKNMSEKLFIMRFVNSNKHSLIETYLNFSIRRRPCPPLTEHLEVAIKNKHYEVVIVLLEIIERTSQTNCLKSININWIDIINELDPRNTRLINRYFNFFATSPHYTNLFYTLYVLHKNNVKEEDLFKHLRNCLETTKKIGKDVMQAMGSLTIDAANNNNNDNEKHNEEGKTGPTFGA